MITYPHQFRVKCRIAWLPVVTDRGERVWLDPYYVVYEWCKGGKSGWWRWYKVGTFLYDTDADICVRNIEDKRAKEPQ